MLSALPVHDFSIRDLNSGTCWDRAQMVGAVEHRAAVLAHLITPDKRNFVIAHGNSPDFFADLFAV